MLSFFWQGWYSFAQLWSLMMRWLAVAEAVVAFVAAVAECVREVFRGAGTAVVRSMPDVSTAAAATRVALGLATPSQVAR
jgi:hypothetical protein